MRLATLMHVMLIVIAASTKLDVGLRPSVVGARGHHAMPAVGSLSGWSHSPPLLRGNGGGVDTPISPSAAAIENAA